MPTHSSMKHRARPNKFVGKTLTTKQTQSACGSQMGGAPPKTAYVMLVPADETHQEGSTINISEGKTGTINELMDVADLKEFDGDESMKKVKPKTMSGKRQIVLGKVGNDIKFINGDNLSDITNETPIAVKYESDIELYTPTASNESKTGSNVENSLNFNMFEQTNTESANTASTETTPAAAAEPAAAAVEEPPVVEEEPYINANEFTNAEIGSEKNTKFTVLKTKKAVKLSKDMSELGYLETKQIIEITSLDDYKNIYHKFTGQNAPNCVFLVYKLKLNTNKPEQYYVFNKFSKPLLLTNAANPVELTTDTCKKNHLLSPEPNEVLKDGFIVESFYNTLKGGKRITLRQHKKFVAKSAAKTLKSQ